MKSGSAATCVGILKRRRRNLKVMHSILKTYARFIFMYDCISIFVLLKIQKSAKI